jgi:phosphoribosylformimino-5-aminoimidazole carboxamide ribotide isomerase
MIVYPAIDLRGGKVVRLKEGDPNKQTTFSENPLAVARGWVAQGAKWLHMVNLDGAFDEANNNLNILEAVAKLDVNVQFGGGLRNKDDIEQALALGASRVVLGTLAMQNPDVVSEAVEDYGAEAICIAMDARDGRVTTHGWTEKSDITPVQFGRLMKERGVKHALYTDVNRDGSMMGVNLRDTVALARNTGLDVIASGGISRMIEIQKLTASGAVAGVIIGMALYKNEISLKEALIAAKEPSK